MDGELNEHLQLTSANSINVARFLPQAFYYFYAYAQLKRAGKGDNAVICVPSGNFGNITAGLFGKRMGLPVERFIASNNRNDIFFQYLQTGVYTPRPSIATIANAMDVGDPSNFARVLDLYGAAMPPSLPKSAVPLIPTSRLPKPCGKCGRRTITCSTRTEPAASGPWPKD